MGDPKFSRKLYDTPSHPWKRVRMEEENGLIRTFGLKNKREVWKTKSMLGRFRGQARRLVARMRTGDLQAEKEKELLLRRMTRMGLLKENPTLDDVLSLTVENILARRFQTILYLKGMAHTPKQARQFIVHGHVVIDGRKVTIPGYLVTKREEEAIDFREASAISSPVHPERPGADKAELEDAPGGGPTPVKKTVKLETGEEEEGGDKGGKKEEGGDKGGKKEEGGDKGGKKEEGGDKGGKKEEGKDGKKEGDKGEGKTDGKAGEAEKKKE